MEICWKKVNAPYDRYSVSSEGLIRNDNTGYILNNLSKIGGYVRARLTANDGKVYNTLVHRIVAIAFLPNPNGKKHVDHINKNRSDNRVENLRWTTAKENCGNVDRPLSHKRRAVDQLDLNGNFIKRYDRICDTLLNKGNIILACRFPETRTAYGYKWRYSDDKIDGEIFKEIEVNGLSISVSNMGRIMMPSGHITFGSLTSGGYRIKNVNKKRVLIHRLVMLAFVGECQHNMVVSHLDNNKENNRLSNLKYTTQSENVNYSYECRVNKKPLVCFKKAVKSISEDGIEKIYKSIAEAYRSTGISQGLICLCCKGVRKASHGLKWQYVQ